MELHHPTADSGLTLIETPGSKSFTRPKLMDEPHLNNVYSHYGYGPWWRTGYMYPMFP